MYEYEATKNNFMFIEFDWFQFFAFGVPNQSIDYKFPTKALVPF